MINIYLHGQNNLWKSNDIILANFDNFAKKLNSYQY